ncbi:hypothetical protein [Anoxybacillus sp. ST4]
MAHKGERKLLHRLSLSWNRPTDSSRKMVQAS